MADEAKAQSFLERHVAAKDIHKHYLLLRHHADHYKASETAGVTKKAAAKKTVKKKAVAKKAVKKKAAVKEKTVAKKKTAKKKSS